MRFYRRCDVADCKLTSETVTMETSERIFDTHLGSPIVLVVRTVRKKLAPATMSSSIGSVLHELNCKQSM